MSNNKKALRTAVAAFAVLAVVAIWLSANFIIISPTSTQSTVPTTSQSQTVGVTSSSQTSTTQDVSTSQQSTGSTSSGPATSSQSTGSGTSTTTSQTASQLAASSCSIFQNLWGPTVTLESAPAQNFGQLFNSYSRMGVSFLESSSGVQSISLSYTQYITTLNGTAVEAESYGVVYASPTTYKVDVQANQSATTFSATAWILRNGTLLSLDYLGQNLTGSEGSGIFQGVMAPFIYEADFSDVVQPFTSASNVQVASQTNAQVGSTSVAVESFSAGSLPLNVQVCGGSFTLTSYSIQTGSVSGAGAPLLVSLNMRGSVTYNYQTYQITSLFLKLTSLQKA